MGEYSQDAAGSGGNGENGFGSCQTQDFSSRQEENRGGTKGTVGEGTGAAEEGGVGGNLSIFNKWEASGRFPSFPNPPRS